MPVNKQQQERLDKQENIGNFRLYGKQKIAQLDSENLQKQNNKTKFHKFLFSGGRSERRDSRYFSASSYFLVFIR